MAIRLDSRSRVFIFWSFLFSQWVPWLITGLVGWLQRLINGAGKTANRKGIFLSRNGLAGSQADNSWWFTDFFSVLAYEQIPRMAAWFLPGISYLSRGAKHALRRASKQHLGNICEQSAQVELATLTRGVPRSLAATVYRHLFFLLVGARLVAWQRVDVLLRAKVY